MTVKDVIDQLGGASQASYTLRLTTASIYQWLKKGYIPDSAWKRIMDATGIGILDLFAINEERRKGNENK